MAEAKYGRLFTEMDVKLVATEAAVELLRRLNRLGLAAYGTRPDRGELLAIVDAAIAHEDADAALTFPPDEPLFLLRGQDSLARDAVDHYAATVRDRSPERHYQGVLLASDTFGVYAQEHPERMGMPD